MKSTNPSSYLTIIVLIILASLNTVYGQGGVGGEGSPTHMNVTPAPPDISSLNKQIDAEASPYTGRANVSIPLYSIKSKSLSIPVTLNYQTSGIKVNDLSGWAGLGWSLSCQYNVNRTILGINDELMAFFDGHVFPYPLDVLSSAHQNSIDAICDGQFEAQPDIFHYSIPGYSGKFVIDVKSRKLVQMEQSNVELRAYFDNTNVLERFVVKDPNGVIYFFSSASQHEVTNTNTTSGIACTGSKNFLNPSNTYSNTWHLTKIADRNRQDSIILVYTSVTSNLIVDVSENHRFADPYNSAGISGCPCPTADQKTSCTTIYTKYEKVLSEIQTSSEVYKFISTGSRADYSSGGSLLNRIERWVENLKKSEWRLSYSIINANSKPSPRNDAHLAKRYFLDQVQFYSGDGSESIPPFEFEYEDRTDLPKRFSWSQDHFGFYNGASNSTYLWAPGFSMNIITNPYTTTDRDPDFSDAKNGILKKIIYPTGGYKEFFYEEHEVGGCGTNWFTTPVTYSTSSTCPQEYCNPSIENSYSFQVPAGNNNVGSTLQIHAEINKWNPSGANVYARIYNSSNGVEYSFDGTQSSPGYYVDNASITLSPGTYTLKTKATGAVGSTPSSYQESALISVSFQQHESEQVTNQSMGGIRIQKIIDKESLTAPASIKKYQYTESATCNGNYLSSGVNIGGSYTYLRKYQTNASGTYEQDGQSLLCPQMGDCEGWNLASTSARNLYSEQGARIVYDRVVELFGETGEFGKSIYEYEIAHDGAPELATIPGNYGTLNAPFTDRSYLSGKLKSKTDWKYTGSGFVRTKKQEFTYEVDESSQSDVIGIVASKKYQTLSTASWSHTCTQADLDKDLNYLNDCMFIPSTHPYLRARQLYTDGYLENLTFSSYNPSLIFCFPGCDADYTMTFIGNVCQGNFTFYCSDDPNTVPVESPPTSLTPVHAVNDVVTLNAHLEAYNIEFSHFESRWVKLIQEKTTLYNEDATLNSFTVNDYEYTNDLHLQRTKTTTTSSNGDQVISEYTYPLDLVNPNNASYVGPGYGSHPDYEVIVKMIENNQGTFLLESQNFHLPADSSTSSFLGGKLNRFQELGNERFLSKDQLRHSVSSPQSAPSGASLSTSNGLEFNSNYETILEFNAYDDESNVLSQRLFESSSKSYLWGYENKKPILGAVNAISSELAYTSFEDEVEGWTLNTSNNSHALSFCGELGRYITPSNIGPLVLLKDLDQDGVYSCTFWVNTEALFTDDYGKVLLQAVDQANPAVTVGSSVDVDFDNTNGDWVLVQAEINLSSVPNPNNYTLALEVKVQNLDASAGFTVDDIRVHPKDAEATSYTYDLANGVSSILDPSNQRQLFEYDKLGRLHLVKDHNRNILQRTTYNYQ